MDTYLKTIIGVFLALILIITLSKQVKDLSVLLSITVCCIVGIAAFTYLQPVVAFLSQLQEKTGIDAAFLQILLKAVGISLLGETAAMICTDAGNSSLGRIVQILASAVILWLSLPLLKELLKLIEEVLEQG